MKTYTLNKANVTKIFTNETMVEKYKSKGFKVIKIEGGSADAVENSKQEPPKSVVEDDVFTCEICSKTYKTEAALKKHITEKHPVEQVEPEQEVADEAGEQKEEEVPDEDVTPDTETDNQEGVKVESEE